MCLTVEQTIVVCRPFHSVARSGRWRQYGLVLIIAIVSFIDNFPAFFGNYWGLQRSRMPSFETTMSPDGLDSNRTLDFTDFLENSTIELDDFTQNDSIKEPNYTCIYTPSPPWHTYIVRVGLNSVGPILILTTCNIIILVKLLTRNQKLATGDSRREGPSQNALVSVMTARTVTISIVHCATTLPVVSLFICDLFYSKCNTVSQFRACNTI